MKIAPPRLALVFCILLLSGCVDADLSKRDDGRYVRSGPVLGPPNSRLHDAFPPLSNAEAAKRVTELEQMQSSLVPEETYQEQKQRETQEHFEDELNKLNQ